MKHQDGGAGHLECAKNICQPSFHHRPYDPMGEWAEESRSQWSVVGVLLHMWPGGKGVIFLFCKISASTPPSDALGRRILGTDWGWPHFLSSFATLRQLKEERVSVSSYTDKDAHHCWSWRCELKLQIGFYTLGRQASKSLTIMGMGKVRWKALWQWCKRSIWEVIWQNLWKATYTAGTPCPALF